MIVFCSIQLYQTRWFHAILLPNFIEFSRCIRTYACAKFESIILNIILLTKLCEHVILLTNIYNRTVSKAQKGWSKLQYQSVKGIAWIWERNGKCYEGVKTMEYSMAKTSRKERIRDMFTGPIHRTMRKMNCEYDNKK